MPLIVVINVSEKDAAAPAPFDWPDARTTLSLSARPEEQIAQLEPADRKAFLEDLGVQEPAKDRLVQRLLRRGRAHLVSHRRRG